MSNTITLGSLFDGSGGFPLAGYMCGIIPVWASEIEPYPIAVTKSRFPDMKHLGDISKINGAKITPVDVITFGSPCQDLSIAGKRAGLKHETNGDGETTRSGLFMEAIRIIKEMRCATNGNYPRFALWENVPGAFSSNKGEDFRIVLEEIIKISEKEAAVPSPPKGGWPYADAYVGDGWSLAYRTFDAQYWGVPQRRRRIYLVADFAGGCAPRVLFEREGLRGYFKAGESPWQRTAADVERSTGTDDSKRKAIIDLQSAGEHGISSCLCATYGTKWNGNSGAYNGENFVLETHCTIEGLDGYNSTLTGNKAATLGVNCGISTGRNGVLVPYLFKNHPENDGGSKDVLWQKNKHHTLSADNNQYLFQPKALANVASTLRAGAGAPKHEADILGRLVLIEQKNLDTHENKNIPCIGVLASCTANAETTNGTISPCLIARAGTGGNNVPLLFLNGGYITDCEDNLPLAAIHLSVFESHPQAGRIKKLETVAPSVTGKYAKGCVDTPLIMFEPRSQDGVPRIYGDITPTLNTAQGGQRQPCVALPVYCIQGNCIDRADTARCNGKGWREDASFALNTIDKPAVVYLASGKDKAGTLMASCSTKQWLGNQEAFSGDYHIIEQKKADVNQDAIKDFIAKNNADAPHQQDLLQSDDGVAHTLACGTHGSGPHLSKTVVYTGTQYIVRRLTPTECARLQGFADDWGIPEHKEDFTDEEYQFWLEVRNCHAVINGKKERTYTKAQMLSWYHRLHSNSSEYKMWGNGVALPPTLYCMQGISDALSSENRDIAADDLQDTKPER